MRKLTHVCCVQCGITFEKEKTLQSSRYICSQACLDARQSDRISKYQSTRRTNGKIKCQVCSQPMMQCESVMKSLCLCSLDCKRIHKSQLPKRINPLSIQYHTSRGLSEEEAKEKIRELQRKRSPRCEDYWIKKGYNSEDAQKMVSQIQKQFCKSNDLSREERQRLSPRAIEYWMAKDYTIEEAILKHKEFNDRSSLAYFVRRYGKDLGQQKYSAECEKRAKLNGLESYIAKYGEADGLERWQNKYKKRGPDSKSAKTFFEELYHKLPKEVQQLKVYFKGHTENEFGIKGPRQYYYYDFVISDIKYCIEFNGSYWHADPEIYESGTMLKMFGKTVLVDDIWKKDAAKCLAIENRGFKVQIVWCKDKKIPLDQIDTLVESIKQRYKEYQNEKTQDHK